MNEKLIGVNKNHLKAPARIRLASWVKITIYDKDQLKNRTTRLRRICIKKQPLLFENLKRKKCIALPIGSQS
jgi:hypothetical protein